MKETVEFLTLIEIMCYLRKFNSMIERLRTLADKCDQLQKVTAGLFYTKKGLLSIGKNSHRTYLERSFLPNLHAEMDAIYNFRKRFVRMKTSQLKLIVIRVSPSGALSNSTPCTRCKEFIEACGIRKVYYINADGQLVCDELKYQYGMNLDDLVTLLVTNNANTRTDITRCIQTVKDDKNIHISGSVKTEIWFREVAINNIDYSRKINYTMKRF
jgi:deoxycytidylate deaminase